MVPVAAPGDRDPSAALHPLHAVILAGTVPLFLGAALSDLAYWKSFEVQWTNFASWLIAGGLLFAGIALAWALVAMLRGGAPRGRALPCFLVLLLAWVLGFIDALVHARDAWAIMPAGLVLSLVAAALACSATWIGFAAPRMRGAS